MWLCCYVAIRWFAFALAFTVWCWNRWGAGVAGRGSGGCTGRSAATRGGLFWKSRGWTRAWPTSEDFSKGLTGGWHARGRGSTGLAGGRGNGLSESEDRVKVQAFVGERVGSSCVVSLVRKKSRLIVALVVVYQLDGLGETDVAVKKGYECCWGIGSGSCVVDTPVGNARAPFCNQRITPASGGV